MRHHLLIKYLYFHRLRNIFDYLYFHLRILHLTELIQNYNVAVVPGTCFGDGGEGFIRCCYATDINKLKIAMERIAEMVSKKIKK